MSATPTTARSTNAVPKPRYSADHRQQALNQSAPLFTLDLDRRHLARGTRQTMTGVLAPCGDTYLIATLERMLALAKGEVKEEGGAQQGGRRSTSMTQPQPQIQISRIIKFVMDSPYEGRFRLPVRTSARFLHAAADPHDNIAVWYEIPNEQVADSASLRTITVIATGQPFDPAQAGRYLATVLTTGGARAWHLYERIEEDVR